MCMNFVQLLLLVIPCHSAVAFPLSYAPTVAASEAYVPLIVVSVSLFFFLTIFLAIKIVYMKHRRIGTIHAPPTVRSIPARCRDKRGNRHGFLVGCLGSPIWETSLTSKLDGASWRRQQRRRSSFAYQLHTHSTTRSKHSASIRSKSNNSSSGSHFTRSTALTSYSSHADQIVLLSSTGFSRVTPCHGGGSSMALGSTQRNISTNHHPCYGDFGEFHRARSPGGGLPQIARRASPSSIRLVDGPTHSKQVEYSFLSGLPPNAIVVSPLMGTRDSFQLSTGRCSLKCNRKPVPPLPSLPAFLPFHMSKGSGLETMESRPLQAREYLPPLRFSPLASMAKVFHSQQYVFENRTPRARVPDPVDSRVLCLESASSSKTPGVGSPTSPCVTQEVPPPHPIRTSNTKSNHKRSQSYKGLAIGGSLPRTPLVIDEVAALPLEDKRPGKAESMQMNVLRTPSGSSRNGSVASKKPLKSCLRKPFVVHAPLGSSPDTLPTPSMSHTSSPIYGTRPSTGDQASIRTPITEDDIGMLGLERFRWNDDIEELKVRSSHMKKDSVALVPLWE